MTEGPEPGRPGERLGQGRHRASGNATPGYGLPPGYAARAARAGRHAAATAPLRTLSGTEPLAGPEHLGGTGRPAGTAPAGTEPAGTAARRVRAAVGASKPGLIPLRPLNLGEILDGAFTAIRWNPKTILTSSAAVATISAVIIALVVIRRERWALTSVHVSGSSAATSTTAQADLALVALGGVTAIVVAFANLILTGVLTVAIGQGVLGRKETLASAWRATRPRIWRADRDAAAGRRVPRRRLAARDWPVGARRRADRAGRAPARPSASSSACSAADRDGLRRDHAGALERRGPRRHA